MTSILEVKDLEVVFRKRSMGKSTAVRAVDGVSLTVEEGETVGIVGESGCGKSTMARAIMRLVEPEKGSVHLRGQELTGLSKKKLRAARAPIQMVFQDPYSSLDPSMLIDDSIREPLDVHKRHLSYDEKIETVVELLGRVGLSPDYMNRYPHEFSGGQRQRLTIARALAADPQLIICDEAVSALDVSTQNQILELLEELSDGTGLSYLFISHDLSVVRLIADRVAVMYLGTIVEEGPTSSVFESPSHPYTQALLSAVPIPDPVIQRERERIILVGDPPDAFSLPSGCRFRTRCSMAMDICSQVEPTLEPTSSAAHRVACHLNETPTDLLQPEAAISTH